MVPSAWVALAELPLTPSGKVDRRALPAPERGAEGSVAPRTGVEQVMAALWSEVLGSAEVGVEESFFTLGGHSLRATRLVSRIHDTFGVSLPVRAIFESPTVAGLARRVEEMRRADGPPPPPVEPAGDVPPVLSFAQERLWFLDSMSPGEATYNVPHPLRIDGPLAVPAFVQALGEVMRRHRVLRTGYGTDDEGRVSARVLPAEPPRVPRIDLGGLAGPDREAAARDVARASARRPFDLARPPLLRAALARIAATGADDPAARHLLALTIHHVVTDAWSRGILFSELAALYQAFSAGRPSPLPELAVQYEDFARWQREQLSGERLERHVRFWRELLAGGDEILDLPTDRPRPPAPSSAGGLRRFGWSRELGEAVAGLARRRGATPFMVLLAAFGSLLHRYGGGDRIHVGSPVSERPRPELEPLVGFFINTLVLPVDLAGDPAFGELVARVRDTALDAYDHSELPFETLVDRLGLARDPHRSPLFQVALALQNAAAQAGPAAVSGLAFETVQIDKGTAKFDLTLTFEEVGPGGLFGSLEYRRDLFDATTAERMTRHLEILVAGVAANPELPVSRLPLLSAPELQQVAREWNDPALHAPLPAAPGPAEASLHGRFRARARSRPEAIAVVRDGVHLSYRELERRAAAVARRVRERGAVPGDLVIVSCRRL
jgi:acyl carrier protein